MPKKRIAVLGSTGSIGVSTLDVVRHLKDCLEIKTLAAKSNIDLLEEQAKEFAPEIVAVYEEEKAIQLQKRLPNCKVVSGMKGLEEAAVYEKVDFVMLAMSGSIGLKPAISAIQAKKGIGLANKEVLICAGELITSLAKKNNVELIPVDSEHSALFQCLQGGKKSEVRRLILTASGGPFYKRSSQELAHVTIKDALAHPNWRMGKKVTIDSSTLMNKGLEVIEAHFLFDMPIEKIEVVIHPQSIIHSLVEYVDSSLLAQLGEHDMKLPIQYALTYPDRKPSLFGPFDFTRYSTLNFFQPDTQKFPCLDLAFEALRTKKSYPCFLNAANEVLVQKFLQGEISWISIGEKLKKLLSSHRPENVLTLEAIQAVDKRARELAAQA